MSQSQVKKRSFRPGRALVFLPFTLLLAAGCAQIIGLGDYTVASDESGGSHSGGNGATGGKAGSAGKSGQAGMTSEAGAGGNAGQGGEPGSTIPVGCDGKTPLTVNDQVIQSCILRVSCDPFNPVRTISTCVTNNTQDAFAGERCNLKSKTCADYTACEHNGIAGDDLCPEAKWGTDFCVGNKSISCTADGKFSSFVDCVGEGASGCGMYTDPTTQKQTADCTLTGQSCTGVTTDFVCSNEATPVYQYHCIDDTAYGIKCGDFSYCGTDSMDKAHCYLSAQSCAVKGTTCSASNVAKVCSGGGEYDYDCGSVGLTCTSTGGTTPDNDIGYCLAPGCKPADVTNCSESCDGTKLTFCYGGANVTVDCVDYGFSNCETFTNSSVTPSFDYAACVNQ